MSSSNNSPVSTLTLPSTISINYEVCSLQNPIHEEIKYSYFSKIKEIAFFRASDVMKKQVKLLSHKTRHNMILGYFLKDKVTNEFVSETYVITNLPT